MKVRIALVVMSVSVLFASCMGIGVYPGTGEEEGSADYIATVDDAIRELMRKQHIAGLSIGIVDHGSVLALRGYGHADRESDVPATPDTVFRAYSIAKVFTALETVRLADDGIVSLDSPVSMVLPEWQPLMRREESPPVTVRHLLTHRGGLPRNSNLRESEVPLDDCLRLQVESLSGAWAAYPAEYRYKYSNVGFNALGRVIELERNHSFAFYMTTVALPSYGLHGSTYFLPLLPPGSVVATGYVYRGSTYEAHAPYDINGLASGNLYTTATDLTTFITRVLGEETGADGIPLEYDTLMQTYTPQFARASDPQRNGLGWMTSEELVGELMVWHQGGDFDANALIALMPQSDVGICILTNTGSYEGSELVYLAAELFAALKGRPQPSAAHHEPAGQVISSRASAQDAGQTTITPIDQIEGRYIAFGEALDVHLRAGELRADLGPVTLKLRFEGQGALGEVYSVHHWLGNLDIDRLFPVKPSFVRIIVPPGGIGHPDHLLLSVSDIMYEFCPRYPDISVVPESWLETEGEYDGCSVEIVNNTLKMTGVGFLANAEQNSFVVLGGIYDGETVRRDPATGSLFHQGREYRRV